MLFSEPKIPQSCIAPPTARHARPVSVLFSEPKIPQLSVWRCVVWRCASFSALQRAENSSMLCGFLSVASPVLVSVLFSEPKIPQSVGSGLALDSGLAVSVLFSEPKIPQCTARAPLVAQQIGFSALQRAENSSIVWREAPARNAVGFSALQRAENSSMRIVVEQLRVRSAFQCSSASRKFLNGSGASEEDAAKNVSVLFSEPKIPQ